MLYDDRLRHRTWEYPSSARPGIHSITSSARGRITCGTVRPSAFAVFRLHPSVAIDRHSQIVGSFASTANAASVRASRNSSGAETISSASTRCCVLPQKRRGSLSEWPHTKTDLQTGAAGNLAHRRDTRRVSPGIDCCRRDPPRARYHIVQEVQTLRIVFRREHDNRGDVAAGGEAFRKARDDRVFPDKRAEFVDL